MATKKASSKIHSFELYYTVRSTGDGGAGVDFHADKEAAQIACDIETAGGEPFSDNTPTKITLKFNAAGVLQNPAHLKEELRAMLAEARGEDVEPPPAPTPAAKPRRKR